jgi:hypothetical protein
MMQNQEFKFKDGLSIKGLVFLIPKKFQNIGSEVATHHKK